MGKNVTPVVLNLGCGANKLENCINVDGFEECEPDVLCDLNSFPYPWDDCSVDQIEMWHVLEHIPDWWGAFCECARILKVGGVLNIRVPDESSRTALTYRDHFHVFSQASFHGTVGTRAGTNAWAMGEMNTVPLVMEFYCQVPYKKYEWMIRWAPWLLSFCAEHLRNFIWEQRFTFRKVRA